MFKVDNFSCFCRCSSYNLKYYYSACDDFSYDFNSNIYILKGEIDCGAWAFACSISGGSRTIFDEQTSIWLENEYISFSRARTLACNLHLSDKLGFVEGNTEFYTAIRRKLANSHTVFTVNDLFDRFCIPNHVAYRKIKHLGNNYLPAYRAMCGLIEGKRIFTTMWFGQYGFINTTIENIGRALVHYDNMLIIPSSIHNVFSEDCVSIDMLSLFSSEIQKKYHT